MSKKLNSWGRYPRINQEGYVPAHRCEIQEKLDSLVTLHGSTLAFGNGRSYGDSCLASSGHAIVTSQLNKFLSADWDRGVIRAESGVTLQEILAVSIPRGWFLAVTPGTQFVTLGGAIANDVHGKNHHVRGTFSNYVDCFGLLREGATEMICSLDLNPELFAATVGGLGLTGIITWAEIRLIPIMSSQINTTTVRFSNLDEFFELSNELDQLHEYSVAWVDCLAKDQNTGRGVFFVGDHADLGDLTVAQLPKLTIPCTLPISFVNKYSLAPFNSLYWNSHPQKRTNLRSDYEPFFYPLDRILHWNRIYGARGFQQYQCVVPELVAKDSIALMLKAIAASGQGSFLAVLKRCGNITSPGLLSFPIPGVSLALDFPQSELLIRKLFPILDHIVREAGGRLYPAKDAHMTGADFRAAYPNWSIVEAFRDSSISSCFWSRVTA